MTIHHLEDDYPKHDRREEGFKLVGFVDGAKVSAKKIVSGFYPYGKVPIWKFLGYDIGKKYNCETLRGIRKEKGVGKWKK
jgi:hypothetical protein